MCAHDSQVTDRQSSPLGILARLWWMFLGNVVLGFCILFIVHDRGGFFHAADWVFWITLASLVLIRYADIKFLDGRTVIDTQASVTHWIRYAVLLIACSTVVWTVAHVATYLWAARTGQGRADPTSQTESSRGMPQIPPGRRQKPDPF